MQAAWRASPLCTCDTNRYHTEVVAVAVFHFVKLRHNVTVFTRDDPFDMGDVINPYFWKGFRWAILLEGLRVGELCPSAPHMCHMGGGGRHGACDEGSGVAAPSTGGRQQVSC